jgi:putative addiction module killer protein
LNFENRAIYGILEEVEVKLLDIDLTPEFIAWLKDLSIIERNAINARLYRLEEYAHFGDSKDLGEGLYELRWKNGRRIYYARFTGRIILLILGGMKNGQKNDIKKARNLLRKYEGT